MLLWWAGKVAVGIRQLEAANYPNAPSRPVETGGFE
jgi:hypothetical protein